MRVAEKLNEKAVLENHVYKSEMHFCDDRIRFKKTVWCLETRQ